MIDFLYGIDKTVFYFCNQTLANPVSDVFMPFLTDLNQHWYGLTLFAALWLLLIWKGGRKGQIVGLLLIPLITMSDQLSSSIVKHIVARPRPCHDIDGIPFLSNIHMLVPCGSGYSFPSSHAVNNFAVATFLSYYYRKWSWAVFIFAGLVGCSRIAVGVHYPSDVLGGGMIGCACASIIILLWKIVERRYPILVITPDYSRHETTSGEQ
ncbi:MAG: phosphatase PAP2 family protein [Ignavibacteriae bacterium]|nr:phosphatase PAP2 family protein [Ignavibacteria bacterium]MBI3363693.1 phosphatase PAP2 family protein [Ignavibacteriota bacterium]